MVPFHVKLNSYDSISVMAMRLIIRKNSKKHYLPAINKQHLISIDYTPIILAVKDRLPGVFYKLTEG